MSQTREYAVLNSPEKTRIELLEQVLSCSDERSYQKTSKIAKNLSECQQLYALQEVGRCLCILDSIINDGAA